MATCAVCGYEAAEAFKFCPECGAAAAPGGRVQRKVVTVLFCDIVGSTGLGETTDPEALRVLLARYFDRMKTAVERHGGTVEKFIGDAVMAVFGIPRTHEDDALRACHAALDMREALPELGLQGRIGINTGEVVTGTEERLATGDPVNVAARLQQAAEPGEVLLGKPTLELVRGGIETTALEPRELKGKTEPVEAFRLLSVHEAEARPEPRFVGRERELELIHETWERALSEERCVLLTIAGEAGVGKSRLVAEALSGVEARILQGRCLPYGDGITYWPVVETLKQIAELPSDPDAAAAIRSLLGESSAETSAEEIAWAYRKLLEEQAPLIVVFDDIQWGEETFLDLVESAGLLSSRAPILLLCLARLDLAERLPTWPVTIRLEPLGESEIEQLLPAAISRERREQIQHASGGNPLFVTELVAMAGEREVAVPPTLQALLAARLDQLGPAERRVLERGAVEGEVFHRGAVQALAADESRVTPLLAALTRKGLIRSHAPLVPDEDAFRFRHLLVRDAAYDGLPKSARGELHQHFAEWLEMRGPDLVEADEILGHHLEQAYRYKAALGESDPGLAGQAAKRLAAAGRRALWRGDSRAAAGLLERALELTRPEGLDVGLELDLAEAVFVDGAKAARIAEAAAERALADQDRTALAVARAAGAFHRSMMAPDPAVDELEALALEALPLLEEAGDHAALVRVWRMLGFGVANFRGRWEDWARAAEQALHHARLAGQRPAHLFDLELGLVSGPRPADEALQTLDALLPENPHPGLLLVRAWLLAMLARLDAAVSLAQDATSRLRELEGDESAEWMLAEIAALVGDHDAAVSHLRRECRRLVERGQRFFLSSLAPMLGRELCALGRHDEAESWSKVGRELGVRQNVLGEAVWRQVQAMVEANRGRGIEAEALAREAVALIERTDGLNFQGDTYRDLAVVLSLAGKADASAAALEQALDRYERKRNLVMAERVRETLATTAARP